jgi:hypothetical protein
LPGSLLLLELRLMLPMLRLRLLLLLLLPRRSGPAAALPRRGDRTLRLTRRSLGEGDLRRPAAASGLPSLCPPLAGTAALARACLCSSLSLSYAPGERLRLRLRLRLRRQ